MEWNSSHFQFDKHNLISFTRVFSIQSVVDLLVIKEKKKKDASCSPIESNGKCSKGKKCIVWQKDRREEIRSGSGAAGGNVWYG